MVKYLSEQWQAEVDKELRAHLSPEKMNNISSSMNNRYLNCPGGGSKFFFVSFVDGKVDKVLVGEGEGPKAEFYISVIMRFLRKSRVPSLALRRLLWAEC